MDMLTWNVLRHDVNRREIVAYNVFMHGGFSSDVLKLKSKKLKRDGFSEELSRIAQYYFWSKCEAEIVVSSWPVYISVAELSRADSEIAVLREKYGRDPCVINISPDVGAKIDIYYQLRLNWDAFVDYCFENKM